VLILVSSAYEQNALKRLRRTTMLVVYQKRTVYSDCPLVYNKNKYVRVVLMWIEAKVPLLQATQTGPRQHT